MINKLTLINFRNYTKKSFVFSGSTTVITGPNASGKTNILESIYLLSTGRSFKARKEEEMVNYNVDIARVTYDGETKLEVIITRGKIDIGAERPEKVPRKKLLVNGVPRHLYNFAGNLKVVIFGPWDMEIVTESPSVRRNFLDAVLSQVDREYRRTILSYEKGLRQRNKLLYQIREEGISRNVLTFWNQLLVKSGDYITSKRREFIDFANGLNHEKISAKYQLEYDPSTISESRLLEYKEAEVSAATTLVGPHRDDFMFKIENGNKSDRDLARYGSRGEQRIGVLWLKLAEMAFIEKVTETKPTLLLDDIFSELDHEHRDLVVEVCKNQQTIITTADEHFVENLGSEGIINL
jgi:DNA replication and repair protein RecF